MQRFFLLCISCLFFFFCFAQPATPDKIYGDLFAEVQMRRIFSDSKTFADAVPKKSASQIMDEYKALKKANPGFNLKSFVEENFWLPTTSPSIYKDTTKDVVQHISTLWKVLQRRADTAIQGSSLLPLPFPYIVPGGRFREVYYWDSYFTMLGLKESGEYEMIENMIRNFAFLIDQYGHIPNGNRTYYLSRSQPPFFSLMIELLAGIKGDSVYAVYQKELEKEYDYWMDKGGATKHVVQLLDGIILNRYYDQSATPRQESFYEDSMLVRRQYTESFATLYRDLRSAAESGWDFSSRWLMQEKNLHSIHTTDLVPVDLNCLLYHLEKTLEKSFIITSDAAKATAMKDAAEKRKSAIIKYCWSQKGWFVDYDFVRKKPSAELTLAGMFPFFFQVADAAKMKMAVALLQKNFVKSGGVVTTLKQTGQQWDAPNGWAPLQWITINALENYGYHQEARNIATRWVALNKKVYAATGKLMEKYDVISINKKAGGGEYPSQDGFGWTNGVLLALINKYGLNK